MVVHLRHAGARGVPTGGAALLGLHAVLRARARGAPAPRARAPLARSPRPARAPARATLLAETPACVRPYRSTILLVI